MPDLSEASPEHHQVSDYFNLNIYYLDLVSKLVNPNWGV